MSATTLPHSTRRNLRTMAGRADQQLAVELRPAPPQLSLAVALLLTAKLIDWRDRWSPA
jgi:hypothetical protein